MKLLIRREHLDACKGFLTSAIVHLFLVILFTLLMAPLAGNLSKVIEIESSFVDVGQSPAVVELEALEALGVSEALPALKPAAGPILSEAVPGSGLELEVLPPGLAFSSGRGGKGRSSWNSGVFDGSATGAGAASSVSFFGTQARGNRIVYVLDVSSSMHPARLQRAVLELLRSIDELREYQEFYVLVFSWETRLMFDESTLFPRPIPASLENKKRIRTWLAGLNTAGGTDPREALRLGLRLHPDALFLLSDGEFNKPSPGQTKTWSGDWAAHKQSVLDVVRNEKTEGQQIHTVAFEIKRSEAEMKQLAIETHGIHRFVPEIPSTATKGAVSPLRTVVNDFRFEEETETSSDLIRSLSVNPD